MTSGAASSLNVLSAMLLSRTSSESNKVCKEKLCKESESESHSLTGDELVLARFSLRRVWKVLSISGSKANKSEQADLVARTISAKLQQTWNCQQCQ